MVNSLFRIAEESGTTVEYCRLPLNLSVSAFDLEGDIILMDYTLINSGHEETVHLAHELGHCVTGSFYNPYASLDVRGKHEYRANKWAYETLLPHDDLMKAVETGTTEIWQIAERFDLPEDFTAQAMEYYHEQELAG